MYEDVADFAAAACRRVNFDGDECETHDSSWRFAEARCDWASAWDGREAEDRVRKLHSRFVLFDVGYCSACHDADGLPLKYPCSTIKALEGWL